MFLSKIFGMFKKKKENPVAGPSANPSGATGAVVPPSSGAVGTAVGMSQPSSQPFQPNPSPTEVAQAPQDPFSAPPVPSPSSDTSFSSGPTPPSPSSAPSEPSQGTDNLSGGIEQPSVGGDLSSAPDLGGSADSQPPADNLSLTPEVTLPPAGATPDENVLPPSDDNQNIAV